MVTMSLCAPPAPLCPLTSRLQVSHRYLPLCTASPELFIFPKTCSFPADPSENGPAVHPAAFTRARGSFLTFFGLPHPIHHQVLSRREQYSTEGLGHLLGA